MSYEAEIGRRNPACMLFLIDQSESMSDPFGGDKERSKADKLADAINRLLFNLLERCAGGEEGKAMDRFEIGVIGYGLKVGPAWSGLLAGRNLVWISEIEDKARVEERRQKFEDGAGGLVERAEKFRTWFDPVAQNGTPMCQALRQARSLLEPWIQAHPKSFPPIVFNITDGISPTGKQLMAIPSSPPRYSESWLLRMAISYFSTFTFPPGQKRRSFTRRVRLPYRTNLHANFSRCPAFFLRPFRRSSKKKAMPSDRNHGGLSSMPIL